MMWNYWRSCKVIFMVIGYCKREKVFDIFVFGYCRGLEKLRSILVVCLVDVFERGVNVIRNDIVY